ncbi:hypothetical protein ACHAQA_007726 [Verticillium albo-atrum]
MSNRVTDVTHYRRSRTTPEDQAEVTELMATVKTDLARLWDTRPAPLQLQPDEVREHFSAQISGPLIALCGVCIAAFHSEVIVIGRILGDPPFPSDETKHSKEQIRSIVDGDWNVHEEDGSLNPGLVRPLFVYALESFDKSELSWVADRMREIKHPMSRSNFLASFIEVHGEAQRVQKQDLLDLLVPSRGPVIRAKKKTKAEMDEIRALPRPPMMEWLPPPPPPPALPSTGEPVVDISPAAWEIMKSGRFSPMDLAKLRPVSTNWPTVPGIYLLGYQGVDNEAIVAVPAGAEKPVNFNDNQYWDQLLDMLVRDARHLHGQRHNTSAHHYGAAAKAKTRTTTPIVLLAKQTQVNMQYRLDAAELTFMAPSDSWLPLLRSSQATDMNLVGSYTIDFSAARILGDLGKQASAQSVISRMWFRRYDPEKSMYIFRGRRTLRSRANGVYFCFQGLRRNSVEIHVAKILYDQATLTNHQVHIVI